MAALTRSSEAQSRWLGHVALHRLAGVEQRLVGRGDGHAPVPGERRHQRRTERVQEAAVRVDALDGGRVVLGAGLAGHGMQVASGRQDRCDRRGDHGRVDPRRQPVFADFTDRRRGLGRARVDEAAGGLQLGEQLR